MRRGTRQWRKLRAAWQARIEHAHHIGEPILCRRTGQPIAPGDRWQLGHPDWAPAAIAGEHTTDLWPEMAGPNEANGSAVRAQLQPTSPRAL